MSLLVTIDCSNSDSDEEEDSEKDFQPSHNLAEGVVQWFPTLQHAKEAIKEYEEHTFTKFIKLSNHSYDLKKSRIRWDEATKIPYIITRTILMECQHAKDRNKQANERRKQHTDPYVLKRKYNKYKESKKLNCKATVSILEIMKFPQYKFSSPSLTKHLRNLSSRDIREMLRADNGTLIKDPACRVVYPLEGAHTGHAIGDEARILQDIERKESQTRKRRRKETSAKDSNETQQVEQLVIAEQTQQSTEEQQTEAVDDPASIDWVLCTRCNHWFHCSCMTASHAHAPVTSDMSVAPQLPVTSHPPVTEHMIIKQTLAEIDCRKHYWPPS